MKPRVSEGSTDDSKSPQSDPYNQRRMVRGSSSCSKDYPPLQPPRTIGWIGKRFVAGRQQEAQDGEDVLVIQTAHRPPPPPHGGLN